MKKLYLGLLLVLCTFVYLLAVPNAAHIKMTPEGAHCFTDSNTAKVTWSKTFKEEFNFLWPWPTTWTAVNGLGPSGNSSITVEGLDVQPTINAATGECTINFPKPGIYKVTVKIVYEADRTTIPLYSNEDFTKTFNISFYKVKKFEPLPNKKVICKGSELTKADFIIETEPSTGVDILVWSRDSTDVLGTRKAYLKLDSKVCKETKFEVVEIASIELDKKSTCLKEKFKIKAVPSSGNTFEKDSLKWEFQTKSEIADAFQEWKTFEHTGEQSFEEKFDNSGVYKFRAKCCDSGEWVESKELYVVEIKELQYKKCDSWTKAPDKIKDLCADSKISLRCLPKPNVPKADLPGDWLAWSGIYIETTKEEITIDVKSGDIKGSCGSSKVKLTLEVDSPNEVSTIEWEVVTPTYVAERGPSVTNNFKTIIEYEACLSLSDNKWRLKVRKISGSVKIKIRTGGSRDPNINPPLNEKEAVDAINIMANYSTNLHRGSWHTSAASLAHENVHYTEWQGAAEMYWPETEICLEKIEIPCSEAETEQIALGKLKIKADSIRIKYWNVSINYNNNLPDGKNNGPYIAGQAVLNVAITIIQNLALTKTPVWVVPQGVSNQIAAAMPPKSSYTPCQ